MFRTLVFATAIAMVRESIEAWAQAQTDRRRWCSVDKIVGGMAAVPEWYGWPGNGRAGSSSTGGVLQVGSPHSSCFSATTGGLLRRGRAQNTVSSSTATRPPGTFTGMPATARARMVPACTATGTARITRLLAMQPYWPMQHEQLATSRSADAADHGSTDPPPSARSSVRSSPRWRASRIQFRSAPQVLVEAELRSGALWPRARSRSSRAIGALGAGLGSEKRVDAPAGPGIVADCPGEAGFCGGAAAGSPVGAGCEVKRGGASATGQVRPNCGVTGIVVVVTRMRGRSVRPRGSCGIPLS